MSQQHVLENRLEELRQAFDHAFTLPQAAAIDELEHVIAVRIAGAPYAIRLRDISGLVTRPNIVRVPAQAPGLLGLAGLRGEIVPVFGLAMVIGCRDEHSAPPWMVLCGAVDPIGLAFAEFEGYLRYAKSAFHGVPLAENGSSTSVDKYINEVLVTDHGPRPVVAISRVVATLQQGGRALQIKEQ